MSHRIGKGASVCSLFPCLPPQLLYHANPVSMSKNLETGFIDKQKLIINISKMKSSTRVSNINLASIP